MTSESRQDPKNPETSPPPVSQLKEDWRSEVLEASRSGAHAVRTYSRLAPVYEVWARLTESKARARVLDFVNLTEGESVLEVATGTGVQLCELAGRNRSGHTVGIELSEAMLERTRRRLEADGLSDGVDLLRADALDLPFEDESFDLVTNAYMLDLLARDQIPRALAEMKRVLRPGGRLVLSNMTKAEKARHGLWDWLYARGLGVTANCRGVLAAPVLRELGFAQIHREYMAQMTFPTEIVFARKPDSKPPAV
jgi:ubiquinone/menaquinone biosynthesis C-methylase UbiE